MKLQIANDIRNRFLGFFLTLVIILSVFPTNIHASGAENYSFKLDLALAEEFQQHDYITFLVKMKEQVNLDDTREHALQFGVSGLQSEEISEQELRGAMVQTLQQTSENSQNRVLQYLDSAKQEGLVKEYESFFIVNSLAVTATLEVATRLASMPEVERIIENKRYQPEIEIPVEENETSLDADELIPYLQTASSQSSKPELPWNLKNIHVEKVWEQNYDGDGVVIGIIDSGADVDHPAIKDAWRGHEPGKAIYSWLDATTYRKTDKPIDKDGHGTHVLGTILGKQSDNGMALGVAPKAKWIAVKVLDDDGTFTTAGLLRAGQWIMAPTDEQGTPHPEMAPKVVNNSWGSFDSNEFFREILQNWRSAGILPVFSAGNTRYNLPNRLGTVTAPAKYPEAFAVGALDKNNKVAPFSLLGPSDYKETKPEISAPGVNIKSSIPGGLYGLKSGTSMASPHVTGVAAILLQVNPNLTVDQLENILMSSADPRSDEKYVDIPNNAYGHGSLNAHRAVEMAKSDNADALATLKGRILTRGKNLDTTGIEHYPLSVMYKGFTFELSAVVKDKEGVSEVNFYMKKESEDSFQKYPMKLASGNKLDGNYTVEIDPDSLAGAGQNMNYYISAVDSTGTEVTTDRITSQVSNGIKIGYHQGFESYPEGFVFAGKTPMWQWGKPESGPESAASGENVVGTNLKGKYKGLEESILVTPVIDLTDKNAPAALTFKHWYDMDSSLSVFHDTAEIWIGEVKVGDKNAEKADFKLFRSYRDSKKSWDYEYIDLAGYKGKCIVVMFGVRYGGFSGQNKMGWYIDDIKIEEPSAEIPPTPYEYLSGRFNSNGAYTVSFYKLTDPKVTDYVLYRSTSLSEPFEAVATVKTGEISYKNVSLTDYPKPQVNEYYYYATARIGENESAPTQIFKHTFTEGKRVQFFNFESDDQGWSSPAPEGAATPTVWTRGIADETKSPLTSQIGNAMPTKATSKGKNDGPTVWGTELLTFRKPNSQYTLLSPKMDLSKVKNGRMYFQAWFNTFGRRGWVEQYGEVNHYTDDWGYVYISKDDGASWHELYALKNHDNKGFGKHRSRSVWYLDHLDIPANYLTENFKVKFVLDAFKDTSGAGCGGWYIDDFAIYDIDPETAGSDSLVNIMATQSDESTASATTPLPPAWINLQSAQAPDPAEQEYDIPVVARVTGLESGLYAQSETGSGAYSLKHVAGNHKFLVEAKGYKSVEVTVDLTAGEETVQDIYLEAAEQSVLSLKTVDQNGKAVADVSVSLRSDSTEFKGSTGADGIFRNDSLTSGQYTLTLKKNGYQSLQQEVNLVAGPLELGNVIMPEIEIAYEEKELSYDSGQSDTYYFGIKDRSTMAVRFEATKPSVLKKAKFYFVTEKNRPINDKEFTYSIYGQRQNDGLAGEKLAGPFSARSGEAGNWVEVTLPEEVLVNGEFFVAYTQIGDRDVAPLLAVDVNAAKEHSFILSAAGWHDSPANGGFMIRVTLSDYTVKAATPSNPILPSPSPSPSPVPSPSPSPTTPKATTPEVRLETIKVPQSSPKSDVSAFHDIVGHWAKAEIAELVEKGLFKGVSANTFSPNEQTTRAMLFTVLHRLSGEEAEAGKLWYEQGLNWAKMREISDGSRPNDFITRQELVTMLCRYAKKPASSGNLSAFSDAEKVDAFAKDAMIWASEKGIIIGNPDKTLRPQSNATRAEVVVILSRFMKVINTK